MYILNKVVLKKNCASAHMDTILHHMVYLEQCALYLEALNEKLRTLTVSQMPCLSGLSLACLTVSGLLVILLVS